MQVMFTETNGAVLSLEAAIILGAKQPSDKNKAVILETHLMTTMVGPGGNVAFSVRESVQECARRINYARTIEVGKPYDASLLGFDSH